MRHALLLFLALPLVARATPGQALGDPILPDRNLNDLVITQTGHITLSSDGLGMIGNTGLLQVNKPSAGATVRAAYLAAAAPWYGGPIGNGCITLAGSPVTWSLTVPWTGAYNSWADVTAIIGPYATPFGAGIFDVPVYECNSGGIDGSALYVIFDDPATSITRTAVVAFGAQAMTGDQFAIGFGQPVNVDANTVIEMGLAIGYSYSRYTCQTSYITVNGSNLSTSAGGDDDGEDYNGALVTVGGIGDSRANPANPNYGCQGDFTNYDDELYDIAGFVNTGDTGVLVSTYNPSNDDNIFAAHLLLDFAAVVGEGIVLTPAEAVNCLCENHTVTATVQDNNGNPVINTYVQIYVQSGPGGPAAYAGNTDANGQFSATYSSCQPGTDTIIAGFYNSQGLWETSNYAYKTWRNCTVEAGETVEAFSLAQNSPNPFNPSTTIAFNMPETGAATLQVFTVGGELVRTVELGLAPRGANQVTLAAGDLASGVYVYTLRTEFGILSHKMLLLK
jgi:hypothetical protein